MRNCVKSSRRLLFNTGSSLMSGNENKVVINLSSEMSKEKWQMIRNLPRKVEFNLTGAVPGQNRMFCTSQS